MTANAPLILIVEDSDTMREVATSCLEQAGYRIIEAEQGIKGYDMARTEQPALILLDVTMPGLDGFEIANMLKTDETTKEIPIMFMTGHGEKKAVLRGFSEGADDYLVKPFDFDVLLGRVAAVLRRTGH
jgi:DNA-binding response OmpR family regulator